MKMLEIKSRHLTWGRPYFKSFKCYAILSFLYTCCNAGQTVWRHTHMYGISPFVVLVLCCRYVNMYKIQMLWITWHTKKLVNMWTIQVFLWELSWSTQIMYCNYMHITYVPCLIVLKATFFPISTYMLILRRHIGPWFYGRPSAWLLRSQVCVWKFDPLLHFSMIYLSTCKRRPVPYNVCLPSNSEFYKWDTFSSNLIPSTWKWVPPLLIRYLDYCR